jgi:methyl-accepting chemotaxis protein
MNNLTVRTKLTMAFGGMVLILSLVAALAVSTLGDANERFRQFVTGVNARANVVQQVRQSVDLRAIAVGNLTLVTWPDDVAIETANVTKAQASVTAELATLQKLAEAADVPDDVRRMIAEIAKVEKAYAPVSQSIVQAALAKDTSLAISQITDDGRPLLAALIKATDEYTSYTREHAELLVAESEIKYLRQRNMFVFGYLLGFGVAVVAGMLIIRSLTRSLGGEPAELCEAVKRVADGDFATGLQIRPGDTNSVLVEVDRMRLSLTRVVTAVRQGSDGLSMAASEIAQGNSDLSARTESQASALEETAASMEELNATVKQNADSARQASQLAEKASAVAVQGGDVVAQAVATMKGINESSRKIGDIISVIDGIAFQTNILALNAAVEAARAGEQGRGFAVVASEVRSLAGRSAEAAKEIKQLIAASVSRVEQGSALVNQAGETMTQVVSSIRRVTDMVGEISAASTEQSAGVAQVGEAVQQMDLVTQQNAALVEQMAASAMGLQGQAEQLVEAVSVFRIAGQDTVEPAPEGMRLIPGPRV